MTKIYLENKKCYIEIIFNLEKSIGKTTILESEKIPFISFVSIDVLKIVPLTDPGLRLDHYIDDNLYF